MASTLLTSEDHREEKKEGEADASAGTMNRSKVSDRGEVFFIHKGTQLPPFSSFQCFLFFFATYYVSYLIYFSYVLKFVCLVVWVVGVLCTRAGFPFLRVSPCVRRNKRGQGCKIEGKDQRMRWPSF